MSKNSLYLSAFLILISGTYIQATSLGGTNPVPDNSVKGSDTLAKCIQDCENGGGAPGGKMTCEEFCNKTLNITDTNSQKKDTLGLPTSDNPLKN